MLHGWPGWTWLISSCAELWSSPPGTDPVGNCGKRQMHCVWQWYVPSRIRSHAYSRNNSALWTCRWMDGRAPVRKEDWMPVSRIGGQRPKQQATCVRLLQYAHQAKSTGEPSKIEVWRTRRPRSYTAEVKKWHKRVASQSLPDTRAGSYSCEPKGCLLFSNRVTVLTMVSNEAKGWLLCKKNMTNIFQLGWNHQLDLVWEWFENKPWISPFLGFEEFFLVINLRKQVAKLHAVFKKVCFRSCFQAVLIDKP